MEQPSVLFRISSVFFRCQKYVKKRVHGNEKMNLPSDFKKCPGSLHFTLLSIPCRSHCFTLPMDSLDQVLYEKCC